MNYEDDELERMRARREGRSSRASQAGYSSRGSSASGTSRRRVSSTVENSQRKGAAVQYVPATAVLRALEVEKRVRDAAAAITVNRHATESI